MTLHIAIRRPRAIAAILVATTASLGLAACSSGAGSSTDNTVTFYSWDNADMMKPVLDGFEAKYPDIKVEVTYGTPVQGYISTLQTRLGSGTAPDVFIITAENKQQIMDGGFAKDLSNEPWLSTLAKSAKDTYTKDGKVYGAATSSWGGGILYNQDLLQKVGFTNPPQTWNDFLDLCAKLKAAGIQPFYEPLDGIPVSVAALVGLVNVEHGGTLDADIWAGKTTFADTWTKPLEQWSELFTKGLEPSSVTSLTGDQVASEFEKGNVAMIGTGSWALGGIQAAAPSIKLNFMAVPGADATYWAGAVSPGYAINAKATHPSSAEKFVAYLVSAEGVKAYQQKNANITTTSNFTPQLDPALSAMAKDVRGDKFYLPQVTWPTHSAELNQEAVSQLQMLAQGQTTPAKVAADLDTKLKSLG